MHGIENNAGVGVHCARCPSFLSLALSLSLSLPDFDAAGQATTRLAKRCSLKERGKEEATARDISVLETGNVMGRFSRWILAAFFEIVEHIYMCVLRNWYYFNEQEQ